jgi:hypothetical protein
VAKGGLTRLDVMAVNAGIGIMCKAVEIRSATDERQAVVNLDGVFSVKYRDGVRGRSRWDTGQYNSPAEFICRVAEDRDEVPLPASF